jgi:hypothetical protein
MCVPYSSPSFPIMSRHHVYDEKQIGKLDRQHLELDTSIILTDPQSSFVSVIVGRQDSAPAMGHDVQGVCFSDSMLACRPCEPDLHRLIMSDINPVVKLDLLAGDGGSSRARRGGRSHLEHLAELPVPFSRSQQAAARPRENQKQRAIVTSDRSPFRESARSLALPLVARLSAQVHALLRHLVRPGVMGDHPILIPRSTESAAVS